MAINPDTIEITIQTLVLEGFLTSEKYTVGATLEAELARLIAQGGLPGLCRSGLSLSLIKAGVIPCLQSVRAGDFGINIAAQLYKTLNRGEYD